MTSLALSVDITAALKEGFKAAFGSAEAAVSRVDTVAGQLENRLSTMQGWRAATREASGARKAWAEAERRARDLERQLSRTDEPTDRLRRETARAREEATRARDAYQASGTSLRAMSGALRSAGVSSRGFAAELSRTESALAAVTQRRAALDRAMGARDANAQARSALRGQIVETVALGAALAVPIHAAIGFESAMADVKKVVNFETPAAFAAMSSDILRLSTEIPMAAEGIADIVAAAGQAGIAQDELRRFAADAATMGVAFDVSGRQAGDAMAGLRTIFAVDQAGVVALGDAFNHLSNNMDATAPGLLNIANRAGAVGKLFGLSGAQVGALGATFLSLKTPPEVAATGINAMLNKLATADRQGKKFQEGLREVGLSARDLKDAIADDAQGALLMFLDAVRDADDVQGVLADMFGQEYSDDMAKLVGGLDKYKEALGLVAREADYAGSMQREYEERVGTTQAAMRLFANQMNRLAVNVGTVLLPAVNDIVAVVGDAAGAVAGFAEAFPGVTKAVTFAVGGFVAFRVATLAVKFAALSVKGQWLDMVVGYRKVGMAATVAAVQTRAFSFATLAGGVKGAGRALLAFAGAPIRAVLGGLKALKVAALLNPITAIPAALNLAAELIVSNWDAIWKKVKPVIDYVANFLGGFSALGDIWDGLFGGDAPSEPKAPAGSAGEAAPGDADLGADGLGDAADPMGAGGRGPGADLGAGDYAPVSIDAPRGGDQITINVYAAPGMDSRAIAAEVERALRDRQPRGGRLHE